MTSIQIDYNRCMGDGVCAAECPFGLITLGEQGRAHLVPEAEVTCTRCGHCVIFCEQGAISIDGVPVEQLRELPPKFDLDPEMLRLWMSARRSTRTYLNRAVPPAAIERCMEVASYAPSGKNVQPVRWIVFRRPAVRTLVAMCREFLRERNIYLGLVAALDKGQEMLFHGAPALVLAHTVPEAYDPVTDGVIALTYFELAAHAEGLGTCWSGILKYVFQNHEPVRAFINLPEGHTFAGALMVGYPDTRPLHLPQRNPVQAEWR